MHLLLSSVYPIAPFAGSPSGDLHQEEVVAAAGGGVEVHGATDGMVQLAGVVSPTKGTRANPVD